MMNLCPHLQKLRLNFTFHPYQLWWFEAYSSIAMECYDCARGTCLSELASAMPIRMLRTITVYEEQYDKNECECGF